MCDVWGVRLMGLCERGGKGKWDSETIRPWTSDDRRGAKTSREKIYVDWFLVGFIFISSISFIFIAFGCRKGAALPLARETCKRKAAGGAGVGTLDPPHI